MIAIICKDVEVFSLPLGGMHQRGYDILVKHVCQINCKGLRWTGFSILPNRILTAGFFEHGNEFDLEFPKEEATSGFLTQDWGEIIELNAPRVKDVGGLHGQTTHPQPKQMLAVIGSILGIPFTMATCVVEKIVSSEYIMTEERLELLDEHSVGSPAFNMDGSLVGILEAYIEETDLMVIRSLSINPKGVLVG